MKKSKTIARRQGSVASTAPPVRKTKAELRSDPEPDILTVTEPENDLQRIDADDLSDEIGKL